MPFITQSGSKQYIVEPGQKFVVDRLENKEGEVLELPVLLSFGDDKNVSKIQVKVLSHVKGEKIRVFKYMRKSNYKRQYGFRAFQTILEVLGENTKAAVKTKSDDKKADTVKETKAKSEKPAVKAKKTTSKAKKEVK